MWEYYSKRQVERTLPKKHAVKFREGTECKKVIISVREHGQSEWKQFVANEHSKKESEINT